MRILFLGALLSSSSLLYSMQEPEKTDWKSKLAIQSVTTAGLLYLGNISAEKICNCTFPTPDICSANPETTFYHDAAVLAVFAGAFGAGYLSRKLVSYWWNSPQRNTPHA